MNQSKPSPEPRPLCVFDLDQTLLEGRTIMHLGDHFGNRGAIEAIWSADRDAEVAAGVEESKRIARLFEGVDAAEFERVCQGVPFRAGAHETVKALQAEGFRVGVVSASFTFATGRARRELGLDFDVGVELVVRDGRLTGELVASAYPGPCDQYVCKAAVLETERLEWNAPFALAVGDGRNDVCMMEAADVAVGVEPCHPIVRKLAVTTVDDLRQLPDVLAPYAAQWRPA